MEDKLLSVMGVVTLVLYARKNILPRERTHTHTHNRLTCVPAFSADVEGGAGAAGRGEGQRGAKK